MLVVVARAADQQGEENEVKSWADGVAQRVELLPSNCAFKKKKGFKSDF
jgi:hypothetical protein